MSREIKFRAWDKRNKEMFNVARYDFSDNTVYRQLFGAGVLGEDCEILQFTGLIDKNGTEIYEGDIVTGFVGHSGGYLRKDFPRKVKVICKVIFDRGMFQTVIKKPIQEHQYAYENGDYRTDYYSLRPMFKNASYYRPSDGKRVTGDGKTCEYIEVIGNIYENKELLEKSG